MGVGALRLLLLALLSVGVIGMHTVGHAGGHSASFSHAGAAMEPMNGTAAGLADAADPCDGDCGGITPVAVRLGPRSDPVPGGSGLLIVCLAVLGGLGALALLASALARRYRVLAGAGSAYPAGSAGAAPTLVHRYSLRLVDVAVLRI